MLSIVQQKFGVSYDTQRL